MQIPLYAKSVKVTKSTLFYLTQFTFAYTIFLRVLQILNIFIYIKKRKWCSRLWYWILCILFHPTVLPNIHKRISLYITYCLLQIYWHPSWKMYSLGFFLALLPNSCLLLRWLGPCSRFLTNFWLWPWLYFIVLRMNAA